MLTDPENGELLKLKQDLEEVIDLTRDLIKTQLVDQKKSSYVETTKPNKQSEVEASTSAASSSSYLGSYDDDIEAALLAVEQSVKAKKVWKIGDKCQAKWTEDGNYYDATIEGISDGGEVSVVFDAYQNRSTTTLEELKERVVRNEVFPSLK